MLEYERFDPSSCGFGPPRAPLLPALRLSDLGFGARGTPDRALIDGPAPRHYTRGRYALHQAYQSAGVAPDGALLAPAYHCRTMLDPALALGAPVRFFDVGSDLAPDLGSVRAQMAAGPVRAIVVPHYFGIEQPAAAMAALAALCREHGATLVEDCSHAWQVAAKRAPLAVATGGHAVVASPHKFFACDDGGILWAARQADTAPERTSLRAELAALKNGAARSRASRAAPCAAAPTSPPDTGRLVREAGSAPSPHYQRRDQNRSSLAVSRWIMRHTLMAPLSERRRRHYREWSEALAGLAGGRALFPLLSTDCVPYMFPLEIDKPNPVFYQLKQAGVPIWRWDDMAVSQSAVAARYRTHLLHLPCHQDLSPAQMGWMTALVAKVLA